MMTDDLKLCVECRAGVYVGGSAGESNQQTRGAEEQVRATIKSVGKGEAVRKTKETGKS